PKLRSTRLACCTRNPCDVGHSHHLADKPPECKTRPDNTPRPAETAPGHLRRRRPKARAHLRPRCPPTRSTRPVRALRKGARHTVWQSATARIAFRRGARRRGHSTASGLLGEVGKGIRKGGQQASELRLRRPAGPHALVRQPDQVVSIPLDIARSAS